MSDDHLDGWTMFSVDDHVIEPPETWTSRVPARYRDRCPRVVEGPSGGWAWNFDGQVLPYFALQSTIGKPPEEWYSTQDDFYDMHPGCYDPVARLEHFDASGVVASLGFPTMTGFGGTYLNNNPDRELSLACIQAFNDFMLDEWCGAAPGRYVGLVLMPYWDIDLAITEMGRVADKGARAIAFSERPHIQGFPSLFDEDGYWDRFFAAAQEHELVLCLHIGSSSRTDCPDDSDYLTRFNATWMNAPHSVLEYIMSGTFDRFPNLRVQYSEASIGWIPYVLQVMDRYYTKHGVWAARQPVMQPRIGEVPSAYFGRNIFGAFIEDPLGAAMIGAEISPNSVMAEVDYPHSDTIFPEVRATIDKQLAHLSASDQYLVRRGNAERVFRFTPSGIGAR